MMSDLNWSGLFNTNPKLSIHVKIVTKKVTIIPSDPWKLKIDATSTHIFCATDKEDWFNTTLSTSMYNKKRKWNYDDYNKPECKFFPCLPLRMETFRLPLLLAALLKLKRARSITLT